MGYGLPAAIGAQLGCPEARVICVSGDGSFQMNLQELATIDRYKLPVKIVLFDNQALGMVRQWQQLFFAGRYSEIDLSDNPDFVALAKAFGIPAVRIDSRSQQDEAIRLLLETEGVQYVLTEEGVTRFARWAKPLALKWTDIERIEYSALHRSFIVIAGERSLKISRYLVGIAAFVDLARNKIGRERCISAAAAMDAVR